MDIGMLSVRTIRGEQKMGGILALAPLDLVDLLLDLE